MYVDHRPKKAVLRHCLKQKASFEKAIGEKLTEAQQALVKQIAAFWAWAAVKYISSPKDGFSWIECAILTIDVHALYSSKIGADIIAIQLKERVVDVIFAY